MYSLHCEHILLARWARIWEERRSGLPKPRKLSPARTAWLVEDLEHWGRDRPESDLLPPKSGVYGRCGTP